MEKDNLEIIKIEAQYTVDQLIAYNKAVIKSWELDITGPKEKECKIIIQLAEDTIAYLKAIKKIGIISVNNENN